MNKVMLLRKILAIFVIVSIVALSQGMAFAENVNQEDLNTPAADKGSPDVSVETPTDENANPDVSQATTTGAENVNQEEANTPEADKGNSDESVEEPTENTNPDMSGTTTGAENVTPDVVEETPEPIWYEAAANKFCAIGAVNPNDNFDEPVTRNEFIRIASIALGYEKDGAITLPINRSSPFSDIGSEGLTADRFMLFRSLGIISGDENNNANPDALISRCQAAAIVARIIKAGANGENASASFKDADTIPEWARREVSLFAEKGIIVSGEDIEFRPMDNVTEAELCVILDKALGEIINSDKEFTDLTFSGNVTISGGNVSLKNVIIQGSLLISAAAGDVSLDNVSISGDLVRQ